MTILLVEFLARFNISGLCDSHLKLPYYLGGCIISDT